MTPQNVDLRSGERTAQGHVAALGEMSLIDPLDFTGKTVLVAGGSTGIGNACAQAFRGRGAAAYVWGTRASRDDYANESTANLDGLHYAQVDLSNPLALDTWVCPFKVLDVLVLSQGIALYKRQEFLNDGFQRVLDLNLTSVMRCAMKFHSMLLKSRGAMIIVSSSAAFHATKGNPAYNASKAGVAGLTRTLAQAWASDGIRVNGIAPGFIPTKLTAVTTENAARRQAAEQNIPLGRLGTCEEMANVVLFLASPMSSYVIGQTILADGGMLL